MAMFKGELHHEEVFPYPDGRHSGSQIVDCHFAFKCMYCIVLVFPVLTEEQKQNVAMFVDPVTKFFTVSEKWRIVKPYENELRELND